MFRAIMILAMLVSLALPAPSRAQQVLAVAPDFTPRVEKLSDDFSAAKAGQVEIGEFPHPSFQNVDVSINVSKVGSQTLYGLLLSFREMRSPAEVYSVSARGGAQFEPFSAGRSGRLNCSARRRNYCTTFFLQTFVIPNEALGELGAGRDVDVQVRTNDPYDGTFIIKLPHSAYEALIGWAADQ